MNFINFCAHRETLAAYIRFGKKLADKTQHQLLSANQLMFSARHYKFGDINNNELLIINLTSVLG